MTAPEPAHRVPALDDLDADTLELLHRTLAAVTGGQGLVRIRYRRLPHGTAPARPGDDDGGGACEVWTRALTTDPWRLRGWVAPAAGGAGWRALAVQGHLPTRWTEPQPLRDAAARGLLARWPGHAGAACDDPGDPDGTGPQPRAVTTQAVHDALGELTESERLAPGHTWRRQSSTRGRLTHPDLTDSTQADRVCALLAGHGITAYPVAKTRGRPHVEVVIAPPERFTLGR